MKLYAAYCATPSHKFELHMGSTKDALTEADVGRVVENHVFFQANSRIKSVGEVVDQGAYFTQDVMIDKVVAGLGPALIAIH